MRLADSFAPSVTGDASRGDDCGPRAADAWGTPAMVDVEFTVPAVLDATFADLVAEFVTWVPLPMDRSPDGSFVVTVRLEAGRRWRYRFLVDGDRWVNDWNALDYVLDDDGCGMSVLDT